MVEECKNIFTYCDECEIVFLDFSLLKDHKILCVDINNEKENRYQRKILKKREKGQELHQCCYCDEYFPRKYALQNHFINECECVVVKAMPLQKQKTVKASLDYKIVCDYCESKFDSQQEYKEHHEKECDIKDIYLEDFGESD